MFLFQFAVSRLERKKTYELFVAVKYSAGNHPLNTFLPSFTNTSVFFNRLFIVMNLINERMLKLTLQVVANSTTSLQKARVVGL